MPVRRRNDLERSAYGYCSSSVGKKVPWAGAQLQTLLKMGNNEVLPLKENILRLTKKYMDMELIGSPQVHNLRKIENELKEQYPEIFASEESDKRLFFAKNLVLHVHASRRSHVKRQNKKYEAAASTSPITKHNEKENHQGLAPESNKRVKLKSDNHETPGSISLSRSKQSMVVESERNDHGMPESASSLSRSNESSKPNITYTINDPNQYRDIHSFLESSVPPMTHLMDAFIDFGCINAEFLLTISSWSFEMIQEVLNQLSLGPNAKQMTEMEKFILEYHFKEYFNQLGKKGNSDL